MIRLVRRSRQSVPSAFERGQIPSRQQYNLLRHVYIHARIHLDNMYFFYLLEKLSTFGNNPNMRKMVLLYYNYNIPKVASLFRHTNLDIVYFYSNHIHIPRLHGQRPLLCLIQRFSPPKQVHRATHSI